MPQTNLTNVVGKLVSHRYKTMTYSNLMYAYMCSNCSPTTPIHSNTILYLYSLTGDTSYTLCMDCMAAGLVLFYGVGESCLLQ